MTTATETLLDTARRRAALPPAETRRYLRIQAGLTQQEVADALGVCRVAVTYWESGKRSPSRALCGPYADLLLGLSGIAGGRR